MICVDSSALIAILQKEAGWERMANAIADAGQCLASAIIVHETGMVMFSRRGDKGLADLWNLLATAKVVIVPFDEKQARLATDAFSHFGKGVHSKA